MIDKLRSLKRRAHTNNQKGFTLIELMVVISILGILAAVVTISMIGITTTAQHKANGAELKTVQVALDSMLNDPINGGMLPSAVCPAGPSSDMTTFPTGGVGGHPLYPTYIHQTTTKISVSCDANGLVTTTAITS